MTEQQERGAAAFSLLILASASAYSAWLGLEVALHSHPLGDTAPGRQFMLAIADWSALAVTLKSLPLLVTTGMSIFVAFKLKDWLFNGTLGAAIIGFAFSLYLRLEIGSVDSAKRFWAYSPVTRLEEFEPFVSSANTGLNALVAWFLAIIAILLGIKLVGGGNGQGT